MKIYVFLSTVVSYPVHFKFKYNLIREYFIDESIKDLIKQSMYTRAVAQNRLHVPRMNNAYGERTLST